MSKRRKNQGYLAIIAAVSIGAAAYLWWRNHSEDDSVSKFNQQDDGTAQDNQIKEKPAIKLGKKRLHRSLCVIISNKLSNLVELDWDEILQEDIVFLILPSVNDFQNSNDIKTDTHKIINCDTELGLWACVRTLKKNELLVCADDIKVPDDIGRYCDKISQIKSSQQLMNYLDET
ncbi:PEX22 [Nakaseomyces glabratus]|uniref:Peroxisome assembly protein 22 n=1 Tax=Candida glabrata (strain ATCC 2001 / BCRC 20586 / JCM 3761 / NBRC 0622 / NRRL Y-65 / CBS 138) TaxID=284593 RepID=PEX22_CANGA|nr:uncharacterized protein CAGL0J07194g [Nakaseomyces glabratus]Q6FP25.1 RecName: Full=Peroxisome assembly protein 22; AltName: Full=Peroxin-22 [Nakaseomyces glabratus CBS 138]KAH7598438.1 Peroxisomal biogenesis protein family [Nakaseomyces glabratus]KAH7603867.1 Peroxisomal biogenesis protein family [Nakaseomyces glabratus]KAI8385367.1 Peroxisomal biogenesis protein family [Nakaseomyces glabratus]KAI8395431.1 Peroxisomal biogenesis protein family [Nakaseomyces glabratus]QHS67673.1 PEX22 [Nak|eukprot:XP_448019.1 uncharacterized protein CAGL0J07194g [[Candida] glabrata]